MFKWKYAAHLGLIRLADEGGEGGGSSTPPAAPPATPAPAAPAAPAAGTPPAEPTSWDGKVESLPEPVQKLIGDLRKENADRRTKANDAQAQQREAAVALAKALGVEIPGDDDAPSVDSLTARLTEVQGESTGKDATIREQAVRLALWENTTHGGNPAALTDSRAFLAKVADLDPTAEDFTTKVTDAAKAAVTANPSLATAPVAGASSVEHPGGSGEKTPSPKNLTEAIAAHYGGKSS